MFTKVKMECLAVADFSLRIITLNICVGTRTGTNVINILNTARRSTRSSAKRERIKQKYPQIVFNLKCLSTYRPVKTTKYKHFPIQLIPGMLNQWIKLYCINVYGYGLPILTTDGTIRM